MHCALLCVPVARQAVLLLQLLWVADLRRVDIAVWALETNRPRKVRPRTGSPCGHRSRLAQVASRPEGLVPWGRRRSPQCESRSSAPYPLWSQLLLPHLCPEDLRSEASQAVSIAPARALPSDAEILACVGGGFGSLLSETIVTFRDRIPGPHR